MIRELKAAHRLLDKIRTNYPKLPITIGGDALYVNKPFIDACKNHKMDYILRYKDTVMTSIMEEFNQGFAGVIFSCLIIVY